jgi:virginiamycin B lyase
MLTTLRLSILTAALLCSTLPAWSQQADWGDKLPEGKGKAAVTQTCGICHEFFSRVGAGYTPKGWRTVMRMMVNQGAPIPPDQIDIVTAYLIKNFPEKLKPAAVLIPGPAEVSIKEWSVPTPGSRPHDPLATRDGAFWYSGQMANVLGRIDPKTGKIREYHLKTPHSGPHGLVEDKSGNIWYTGNTGSLIGKLDPKTGAVTEYPLPGSDVMDPHTPVFDRSGILWFTVQNANKVGRLDPKTNEIKLVTSPTAKSRPYGIQINSKGIPFFVDFGINKIASIDPETLEIKEYPLPNPDARPRRLAISSDDVIWYADYGRGYLGRLDPATGNVTEWASPGGPQSQPYGISVIKDVVWYSESGTKPNTIVRFDPKTQKFQTWAIPGPGGGYIVRNTSVTGDGDFLMANSLVNGVTLVHIKK